MSTAVQPVRSQRMSSKGSHGSREGRSTATVAGRAMLSRPRSKETKIAGCEGCEETEKLLCVFLAGC